MSDTVREYIARSPFAIFLAIFSAGSTLFVFSLAGGFLDPIAHKPFEAAFIAWASGFIACYAWMLHWLEGERR